MSEPMLHPMEELSPKQKPAPETPPVVKKCVCGCPVLEGIERGTGKVIVLERQRTMYTVLWHHTDTPTVEVAQSRGYPVHQCKNVVQ